MKLYLLTTRGLGDFYIVATSPSMAENLLMSTLQELNYGVVRNRFVTNIKVITHELSANSNRDMDINNSTLIIQRMTDWPISLSYIPLEG